MQYDGVYKLPQKRLTYFSMASATRKLTLIYIVIIEDVYFVSPVNFRKYPVSSPLYAVLQSALLGRGIFRLIALESLFEIEKRGFLSPIIADNLSHE